MRVLSWNVQGLFSDKPYDEKIQEQVKYIDSFDPSPDIVLLQEVSTVRPELWRSLLRDEAGFEGILDTLDWAEELHESEIPPHADIDHGNGNLTAVSEPDSIELVRPSIRDAPYDDDDLKHFGTNFPEKILVSTYRGQDTEIELWNVRAVPGGSWGEEKLKIFETVYNRMMAEGRKTRILGGDFNSPKDELADGQAISYGFEKDDEIWRRYVNAELDILQGLGTLGMIDVFRAQHGYGELDVLDVSHATRTDDPLEVPESEVDGVRFDHLIASEELSPTNCHYDINGFEFSDHAPIIADFSPSIESTA